MKAEVQRAFTLLALAAAVAIFAASLNAQDRLPSASASDTPRFREAQVGEWATTSFLAWSPRYFNATDISAFDDSFSRRLITSLGLLTAKYERQMDYRLGERDWLTLRPALGVGYGYSTMSSHEEFRLNSVNRYVETSTKFGIGQAIGDLGLAVGYRHGAHELYLDFQSVFALRFQRLKSNELSKIDPVSGLVDSIESPVRNETHKAWFHNLGIGYGLHVGTEPWNYRLSAEYRPLAYLEWQRRSTTTHGFGIGAQADGFRLSDDIGLALHFRFDFYLPKDDFNDIFWFEFGVGVRFS